MSLRRAFRRVASFGRDPTRELEALERNVAEKFTADDAVAWGPFAVVGPISKSSPSTTAAFWQVVKLDPGAGAFTLYLPSPAAPGAGWIWLKNTTTLATAVTIQPLDASITIDGAATASIAASLGSMRLVPDAAAKNWMVF